jgi:DNA mismatch repair protein MutS
MSKSDKASATPVMRQFLTAKEAHKDALLFFRMGDFYELFYDDAVIAARALELTLTSRNKGSDDEIPMAGVPHHAASGYIQRLLEQGFKVAICEQMADPSKVKGIVPREVVRVVTPGIVYDDSGLEARQNHYLVCVERDDAAVDEPRFAIAALDLSTGELIACDAPDHASALGELVRLDPRELLFGPSCGELLAAFAAARPRAVVRDESATPMTDDAARTLLDDVLGPAEARASGASPCAKRAAGRALSLARVCEPGRELPVKRLVSYALGDTLVLDESTQAHLELVRTMTGESEGALLTLLDETKTAPGARLLRKRLLAPRTNVAEIRRRLDAVSLFVTQPGLRTEVRARLGRIADLERLAVKLGTDRAGPRDLLALARSLLELPPLAAALEGCPDKSARDALGIAADAPFVDTMEEARSLLGRALADDPPVRASDGGVIREGFDAALDEARTLTRDGQRLLLELEARLRETSQIPSLKLRFTRVFGWYLEVTRAHLDKAPKAWRRKQTIATGERFTCDELDELADKVTHAEERVAAREAELYAALVKALAKDAERFRAVAARLAEWDVASALAEVAHRDDYVRPEVNDSLSLVIEDGRHPVVEKLAAAGRFVPNDVELDAAVDAKVSRLWLVTGPNMAGKSTLMRQVALIVVLAQMGSYVPARRAEIGIVDRVLTRVGASDNVARGASTFMVEMMETAHVLRRATRRSLVVLDEIGRGTSTYDGLAIAWAVAEHLHDAVGCRAMFATHYHELTELAATRPACDNVSVSAREHEGEIVFLHKLQKGAASQSYGVACARLAGLPEPVLLRAKAILDTLERGALLPSGTQASLRARAGRVQLGLWDAEPPPDDEAGAGRTRERSTRPGPTRPGPTRPGPTRPEEPSDGRTMAHPALEALRNVDIDRMTPLDALKLLAELKPLAGGR